MTTTERVPAIIPSPKQYGRGPKGSIDLKPGYGERKRKREAAKVPLFADVPGVLLSPDEYHARMKEGLEAWQRNWRHTTAAKWMEVRRRLRACTDVERCEFQRRWAYLPHDPWYASEALSKIERARKTS